MEARDEVCGMILQVESAATTVEFGGRTYYFCSDRCKGLFQQHPAWYVPRETTGDSSVA